jgi:hypothetical protein
MRRSTLASCSFWSERPELGTLSTQVIAGDASLLIALQFIREAFDAFTS